MSTAIEKYQPQTVASSIEATANALVNAHKIGSALCRTAFVPKHFQNKPDDAAAAILYGATIDMDPVTALQNIFVIGGSPALYARTMVAIALSKGHEIWTEQESEGSVTVCGRRKGSQQVETVTWTTQMAERAGYATNSKYKTDPRSMLYARASGDVARRIAPDALLGLAHNVEELATSPLAVVTSEPRSGAVTVEQVLGTAQQVDTTTGEVAQHDADTDLTSAADTTPEPISDRQLKALHASMNDLSIIERADRLKYAATVVGRDIPTSNDLTYDEASDVLDALRDDLAKASEQADADAGKDPWAEQSERTA